MNIDFALRFDGSGRTAATSDEDHIRDLLEQLILTGPGERVNRPDFGSGVYQLVFAENSPELAATVQFTTQAAIQAWLGDLIELREVTVTSVDAVLVIDVGYAIRRTGVAQTARISRSLA